MSDSKALAEGVLAIVKAACDPLHARLQAVEREIATLKGAPIPVTDAEPAAAAFRDALRGEDRS